MSRTRSDRPIWLGEDQRKFDHVRIHHTVIHDSRVSPSHFAVYAALAAHAEINTGHARPTLQTIASYFAGCEDCNIRTGLSSRSVSRVLRDLEDWAYISIKEQAGKASSYIVLPPPTPATQSGVTMLTHDTVAGVPTTQTTPTHDTDGQPIRKNQNQELEPDNHSRVFEDLWNVFPRRNGSRGSKQIAMRRWAKLTDPQQQAALAAVPVYASHCAASQRYPLDASTWLHNKLWEGDLAEWQESQGSSDDTPPPEAYLN